MEHVDAMRTADGKKCQFNVVIKSFLVNYIIHSHSWYYYSLFLHLKEKKTEYKKLIENEKKEEIYFEYNNDGEFLLIKSKLLVLCNDVIYNVVFFGVSVHYNKLQVFRYIAHSD